MLVFTVLRRLFVLMRSQMMTHGFRPRPFGAIDLPAMQPRRHLNVAHDTASRWLAFTRLAAKSFSESFFAGAPLGDVRDKTLRSDAARADIRCSDDFRRHDAGLICRAYSDGALPRRCRREHREITRTPSSCISRAARY